MLCLFLPRTKVASLGTPSMRYQEPPKPLPYRQCVPALSKYTSALLACACSAWAGEAPGMQPVPGSWLGHQWHRSAVTTCSFIHSFIHASIHSVTLFNSCAQGLLLTWHMVPNMQSLQECCAGDGGLNSCVQACLLQNMDLSCCQLKTRNVID